MCCVCSRLGQISSDCSRLGVMPQLQRPSLIIVHLGTAFVSCVLKEPQEGRETEEGRVRIRGCPQPGVCLWEQVMRAPPSDCISSKLSGRPEIVSQQRGDCWLLVLCDFSANF